MTRPVKPKVKLPPKSTPSPSFVFPKSLSLKPLRKTKEVERKISTNASELAQALEQMRYEIYKTGESVLGKISYSLTINGTLNYNEGDIEKIKFSISSPDHSGYSHKPPEFCEVEVIMPFKTDLFPELKALFDKREEHNCTARLFQSGTLFRTIQLYNVLFTEYSIREGETITLKLLPRAWTI